MMVVDVIVESPSHREGLPHTSATTVVAETIGEALDKVAPNPRPEATFTVRILRADVLA